MTRGAIVTVTAAGDYGKPRPAVVIQSARLAEAESLLVCLITSMLVVAPHYRLTVMPETGTGLRKPSQIMVDKIVAIPRAKIGAAIGRVPNETLVELDRLLAVAIGLAD